MGVSVDRCSPGFTDGDVGSAAVKVLARKRASFCTKTVRGSQCSETSAMVSALVISRIFRGILCLETFAEMGTDVSAEAFDLVLSFHMNV